MYKRFVKRILDMMIAGAALIILAPLLLLLAVLVRIKLGSPVIFHQNRPGKDEKIFTLCKFRTMTDERDEKGELLPDEIRLTSFGKFLRATSLDELPELWNIVKGDMSLIGPRPLLVEYLPYYTEEEKIRHTVRPGLTGYAQVNGRNFLGWNDRLAKDVYYVKNMSFWMDFKILCKTVEVVFKKEDVAVDSMAVECYLWEERETKV